MSVEDDVESLIEDWSRERSDVEMGSLWISLPLRRAFQRAEASRAPLFNEHGLTPAMLDLLVALRRLGAPYTCAPSDLARSLVLSAAGVSQRLDRLEQSGLIERSTNVDDRRGVFVRLTKDGLDTVDRLIGPYMEHEERILAGLTARQRRTLSELLIALESSIAAADDA